jgi:hypothetical protein
MGLFGKAAIVATRIVAGGRKLSPGEAWDLAIARLSNSPKTQKKTCPRNAYLGLCEAGAIVGIEAGRYGAPEDNPNGAYALTALSLLQSGEAADKQLLWSRVTAPRRLSPDEQMDVVLSLWEQHLLQSGEPTSA